MSPTTLHSSPSPPTPPRHASTPHPSSSPSKTPHVHHNKKNFFQTLKIPSFVSSASSSSLSSHASGVGRDNEVGRGEGDKDKEMGKDKKTGGDDGVAQSRDPPSSYINNYGNGDSNGNGIINPKSSPKTKLKPKPSPSSSKKSLLLPSSKHLPQTHAQENRTPPLQISPGVVSDGVGIGMVDSLIPTLKGLGLDLDFEDLKSPPPAPREPRESSSTPWDRQKRETVSSSDTPGTGLSTGKRRALADIRWGSGAATGTTTSSSGSRSGSGSYRISLGQSQSQSHSVSVLGSGTGLRGGGGGLGLGVGGGGSGGGGGGGGSGDGGEKLRDKLRQWRAVGGRKGKDETGGGGWVISVAMKEWKGRDGDREGRVDWRKKGLVVYASSSSQQLTLGRRVVELVELHQALLRISTTTIPSFPPALLPLLPIRPSQSLPLPKPTTPPVKSSFLSRFRPKSPDPSPSLAPLSPPQSLSGSPSKSLLEPAEAGHGIGVFQFEKSEIGLGLGEDANGTVRGLTPSLSAELVGSVSLASFRSASGRIDGGDTISRTEAFALISAMAENEELASRVTSPVLAAAPLGARPSNLDLDGLTSRPAVTPLLKSGDETERHQTLTSISRYLTAIANCATLSSTAAWASFVRVRGDDLVSEHTRERSGDEWIDVAGLGYDLDSVAVELERTASGGGKIGKGRRMELRKSRSFGGVGVLGLFARSGGAGSGNDEDKVETIGSISNEKSDVGDQDRVAEVESTKGLDGPQTVDLKNSMPDSSEVVRQAVVAVTANPQDPTSDKSETIEDEAARDEILEDSQAAIPPEKRSSTPVLPSTDSKLENEVKLPPMSRADREAAPSPEVPQVVEGETAVEKTESQQRCVEANGEIFNVETAEEEKVAAPVMRKKKGRSGPKVTVDDFELIRVLGKGCAGKVVLVRHKKSQALFAMKAIIKRHVIAHQELTHTLTEQSVLKRMAKEREGDPNKNPFVVKLYWSFHDADNLYLILDFHPGGDLATQLARWGRLGRDRARFYTSEIVEGVESLHAAGVIYRDLKPENAILGADGHIVLVDFGLAAEFPGSHGPLAATPHWMSGSSAEDDGRPRLQRHVTTDMGTAKTGRDQATSFVGTAEYLAPEVIKGLPYSYEVDWWSLGTMLYEALIGTTPFWVDNHAEMYMRVVHEELTFPEDRQLDKDTKSFIRGLLQKDPAFRLCEPRIKKHPYLSMVDFDHVRHKRYIPPYIPPTDDSLEYDIQNFDQTFLNMEPTVKEDVTEESDAPKQPIPVVPPPEDAFDGYDFKDQAIISVVMEETSDKEETDMNPAPRPSIDQLLTPKVNEEVEAEEETPTATTAATLATDSAQRGSHDESAPTKPTQKEDHSLLDENGDAVVKPPQHKGTVKSSRHSRDMSVLAAEVKRTGSPSGSVEGLVEAEDEWDIIDESPGGEDRNGRRSRGRETFFARGVVDKYKFAVMRRKESTIRRRISSAKLRRSPSSSMFLDPLTTSTTSLAGLRSRFRSKQKGAKGTPPVSSGGAKLRIDKPLPLTGDSEASSRSVTSSTVSRPDRSTDGQSGSDGDEPQQADLAGRRMSEPRVSLRRRSSPDKGNRGSISASPIGRTRLNDLHGNGDLVVEPNAMTEQSKV